MELRISPLSCGVLMYLRTANTQSSPGLHPVLFACCFLPRVDRFASSINSVPPRLSAGLYPVEPVQAEERNWEGKRVCFCHKANRWQPAVVHKILIKFKAFSKPPCISKCHLIKLKSKKNLDNKLIIAFISSVKKGKKCF